MGQIVKYSAGLITLGTLWLAISGYPDYFLFERIDRLNNISIEHSAAIERVKAETERINIQASADARVIAQGLEDTRLLVEEKYQTLSREMRIATLEDRIQDLIGVMGLEQAEIDRLERINNGNGAGSPSPETLRAASNAIQRMAAYESQLDSLVRELNRIMQ